MQSHQLHHPVEVPTPRLHDGGHVPGPSRCCRSFVLQELASLSRGWSETSSCLCWNNQGKQTLLRLPHYFLGYAGGAPTPRRLAELGGGEGARCPSGLSLLEGEWSCEEQSCITHLLGDFIHNLQFSHISNGTMQCLAPKAIMWNN